MFKITILLQMFHLEVADYWLLTNFLLIQAKCSIQNKCNLKWQIKECNNIIRLISLIHVKFMERKRYDLQENQLYFLPYDEVYDVYLVNHVILDNIEYSYS